MAAYSTGSSWSFPEDLPGEWVDVEDEREPDLSSDTMRASSPPPKTEKTTASATAPHPAENESTTPTANEEQQQQDNTPPNQQQHRTHYPPRTCRICLEQVEPTFHAPEESSLPTPFQPAPRVTYESPPGDGGRLLRPCKCKGSQKHVHEECLSAWRLQNPLEKRNYWQCPTCGYKYRLQRLSYGRWISSTAAQVALTVFIFVFAMFVLGFVADPIINLYLDPVSTIASMPDVVKDVKGKGGRVYVEEAAGWTEHFVKGLASLGLLGFAKFLLTLSPWHWFNMRGGGVYVGGGGWGGGGWYGGGGRRGGAATGRDRLEQLSWITILIGIATFLYAVWKGVRAWSRRTLEKAGERVMDVPGADDDDKDD